MGVTHVVGDKSYSAFNFVHVLVDNGFHVVSKLRSNTAAKYYASTSSEVRRGRKRKYSGKVNYSKLSRFNTIDTPGQRRRIYWQDVHVDALKSKVRMVVIKFFIKGSEHTKILFSTDLTQEPLSIVSMYGLRFQQEYLFRDGKGFFGLSGWQMRDRTKIREFLNACMWSLNIARLNERSQVGCSPSRVVSMSRWKRSASYAYVGEQIKAVYADEAYTALIDDTIRKMQEALGVCAFRFTPSVA